MFNLKPHFFHGVNLAVILLICFVMDVANDSVHKVLVYHNVVEIDLITKSKTMYEQVVLDSDVCIPRDCFTSEGELKDESKWQAVDSYEMSKSSFVMSEVHGTNGQLSFVKKSKVLSVRIPTFQEELDSLFCSAYKKTQEMISNWQEDCKDGEGAYFESHPLSDLRVIMFQVHKVHSARGIPNSPRWDTISSAVKQVCFID
jgi:hypothetical protein